MKFLPILIIFLFLSVLGCSENIVQPEINLRITDISPPEGSTNVPLGAVISVHFSHPIDQGSVDSLSLTMVGLSGILSLNGTTISYKPSENLLPKTNYKAILSSGIRSINGDELVASKSWEFQSGQADSLPDFPPPPNGN